MSTFFDILEIRGRIWIRINEITIQIVELLKYPEITAEVKLQHLQRLNNRLAQLLEELKQHPLP